KLSNSENRSKDELYEIEKTFNDMMNHLKDSFQKQEIFVSNASHELKTPISIIKSYAQLLQRRGKTHPEVFDESVYAIDSEADRMEQLVHQMLLLAKNRENVILEKIDFTNLCKKTVMKFKSAYNRSISLNISSTVMYVKGNKDQLQQVIYILLDNALKYSDKNVEVILLEGADTV